MHCAVSLVRRKGARICSFAPEEGESWVSFKKKVLYITFLILFFESQLENINWCKSNATIKCSKQLGSPLKKITPSPLPPIPKYTQVIHPLSEMPTWAISKKTSCSSTLFIKHLYLCSVHFSTICSRIRTEIFLRMDQKTNKMEKKHKKRMSCFSRAKAQVGSNLQLG